jgi:hypothetical protein
MPFVSRLLLLCRRPYHLGREEGEAWLRRELEVVLRRDRLRGARLTGLEDACARSARDFDWLIELQLDDESPASSRGSAWSQLVADMRLLGMSPTVALAASPNAIELFPA